MMEMGWSIYPNLEHWIWRHCNSATDFARKIDYTYSSFKDFMKGKNGTTKYTIDKILKVTGLTYEVCFKERKVDKNVGK